MRIRYQVSHQRTKTSIVYRRQFTSTSIQPGHFKQTYQKQNPGVLGSVQWQQTPPM